MFRPRGWAPLARYRIKLKPSKTRRWLISQRVDFWFASAGASGGLLAAFALIAFIGDRELDWLDLVLSELHLGATYDAIVRRRLWRRLPIDVLVVPLAILAATYVLAASSQWVLLTSIAMYAAVWHRGRQSLGIARFYQRQAGGPISPMHKRLFFGAIYLPMAAAIFLYGHLAPEKYEGEPYYALGIGADFSWGLGLIAAGWVVAYLVWTSRQNQRQRQSNIGPRARDSKLASGGALGRACPRRGLWQRLCARRYECFVSFSARRSPRGAIPLFHLRHGEVANGRP